MSTCRVSPLSAPYDAALDEAFKRIMPPGMEPLKLFRTQAHNPRVLQRMLAANLLDKGSISLRERELIILRTCARCGSEYEWGVHVALFSERAGLEATAIAASHADAASHRKLERRDALLFKVVDELHDTSTLSDATWQTCSMQFSAAQMLEIIALVGFYHTISYTTNALGIELEDFAARFDTC
jgi:alkylhydroperoxidase family enzyme